MRFNLFIAIVLATVAVSQATVLLPRSPYHQFLKVRQGDACDTACAVFSAALDRCTTAACLCVSSIQVGLQSCVDCALTGTPSADTITAARDLVDTFQEVCDGFGLTPVTLSTTPAGPTTTRPVVTPPTTPTTRATVVVTPPGVVTSTPAATVTNVNTLSQTVVRPPSTTDTTTGTGIPGLTGSGAGISLHQVGHGFGLGIALFLGTLMAIRF
jgi:hypothetical protein